MIKFRAMTSSAKIQFYSSMGRSMFKFCVIVQPFLMGLFLGMIYVNSSDLDFTTYALIGSGVSTFWSSICFSSASDIQRERWYGTLENIYVAPIGFTWIIFGKIIGNSIAGVLSILEFLDKVKKLAIKKPTTIKHIININIEIMK